MIEIFADGADLAEIMRFAADPTIRGFTTNPTLLRAAGVRDYPAFGRALVAAVPDRPISFEVLATDAAGIEAEAREIAGWGSQVYVKVPILDVAGESLGPVIGRLHRAGVRVNVTAVCTAQQALDAVGWLTGATPSFLSIFAGRIADTGVDPVNIIAPAAQLTRQRAPACRVIWASPRELFNVYQAQHAGCPIITLPPALLAKRSWLGRDLHTVALETAQQFARDAAGLHFQVGV